jgi:hypothetical protein
MQQIILDTIETCPVQGKDVFLIGDMPSFANRADSVPENNDSRSSCRSGNDWTGNVSYSDAVKMTREGDLKGVAMSDKYLQRFEALAPMRGAWQVRDDVAGGVPNVQAFLAGTPLTMRRRERVALETAPLAVAVDLVSSATVSAEHLKKRGALILALVRALSATRPVELWVGGSATPMNKRQDGAWHVWTRLDTAPLDLARAAHVMTCPAVSRGMIYATITDEAKGSNDLHWPYSNHAWSRANMRPVLSRVIGSGDMLTIAAPHTNDELVNNPEQWFERMLKEFGGLDHDA